MNRSRFPIRLSHKLVSALSLLFLVGGVIALLPAYYPRFDRTPDTSTYIWAGPMSDIEWSEVRVLVWLLDDHWITVDYTLRALKDGTYHFDVWTPFAIFGASSRLYLSPGNMTQPSVTPLSDGTTWVSVNASLQAYSESTISVTLRTSSLFSIHEPGKDTAVITFWGGTLRGEAVRMANNRASVGSSPVFDEVRRFLVFVNLPNGTVLSQDTFPSPTQIWATGEGRWADWVLNFTSPLPNFGQSLYVSVSYPSQLIQRDAFFVIAGVLLSTGAGGAFESLRHHVRNQRAKPENSKKSAKVKRLRINERVA